MYNYTRHIELTRILKETTLRYIENGINLSVDVMRRLSELFTLTTPTTRPIKDEHVYPLTPTPETSVVIAICC
jgi:hypothetical protein